ncbi:tetratricopeptide repeat protein [Archangium sp.]|jgi:hypothetical protein|uniref:tetratricopeptide repeat protein n=1 Tax=Archangium sp. TaxID=1872627 RepID=UPI002EDA9CBD
MTSVSRTIGLAALLAAVPVSAWAGVALSGSYQADVLGRVEVRTERERLVAYPTEGGACGLERRRPVLEGEFQGHVLVGRLTLCVQGDSGPAEDTLPILAFYSPVDRSLTAWVRLREGRPSPGLGAEGLLLLQPAPEAVPAAPQARTGAASVARLRTEKRNPEAAKESLEKANKLLVGMKDVKGSVAEFERSITHDDRNWVAFFGLGTAQLMLRQAPEAIEALVRARHLNAREPSIHYHLACAYSQLADKPRAMESLRQAVKFGYASADGSFQDEDLDGLLGSEPEYLGLANQAVVNSKNPAGRRQQTGP